MYRHHLEKLLRTPLDDVLVDEGVLDRAKLQEIQSEQDQSGRLLSDVLVESGGFDEFELAKIQVKSYGLPFVDVKLFNIRREVVEILPFDFCKRRGILPIEQFGQSLAIACWEIPTTELLAEITEKTKFSVFVYIGVRRSMLEVMDDLTKKMRASASKNQLPRATPVKPAATAVAPAEATPAPAAPAAQPATDSVTAVVATIAGETIGTTMGVGAATKPATAPPTPQVLRPAAAGVAVAVSGANAPTAPAMGKTPSPGKSLSGVSATTSVDTTDEPLPPLALPFISMKLHATAQEVAAPRRTTPPRTHNPASVGVSQGSILGPSGSYAPEPTLPGAPLVVPSAGHNSPGSSDSLRPRISRAAPVIPAALASASVPKSAEWESVFDLGESAIRESGTAETPRAKPKPRS